MKKIISLIILLSVAIILIIIYCHLTIRKHSKQFIYNSISSVPYNKTGLLLGTSKYIKGGDLNPFFINRIQTAILLFKNGRISKIIVSGDNSEVSYNEPITMKRELIKQGIPDSVIYLDYAGFRTFDSVIRCREIFGQFSFTIISQEFHLERAVFISHINGIGAIGFQAPDVGFAQGFQTYIREYFARVKVFIDIFIGEEPKFLGEKVIVK